MTKAPLEKMRLYSSQAGIDFNWRKFRSRHFAMHHLDGAIAGLLATELDIVGFTSVPSPLRRKRPSASV